MPTREISWFAEYSLKTSDHARPHERDSMYFVITSRFATYFGHRSLSHSGVSNVLSAVFTLPAAS